MGSNYTGGVRQRSNACAISLIRCKSSSAGFQKTLGRIFFQDGGSAEGNGTPVFHFAEKSKPDSVPAFLTSWEPAVEDHSGGMHQMMLRVFDAIYAACRYGIARPEACFFQPSLLCGRSRTFHKLFGQEGSEVRYAKKDDKASCAHTYASKTNGARHYDSQ